jgi:hypothetical protein
MTRPPTPAIVGMMDRLMDERRGELRRLDLLAHGIELDLDQAGLQAFGQAPDHDDILDKLKIPDRLLAPIWEDWRQSRVLFTVGMPAAIASRGQVAGQAIIDQARAEADRVRELLVEMARLKITGQIPTDEEFLDLVDPADRPMVEGILERRAWYEQVLDQAQEGDRDPVQDQHQTPHPETDEDDARVYTTITPDIPESEETDSTGAGEPGSHSRAQYRSNARNVTNDQIRDQEDDDWSPM